MIFFVDFSIADKWKGFVVMNGRRSCLPMTVFLSLAVSLFLDEDLLVFLVALRKCYAEVLKATNSNLLLSSQEELHVSMLSCELLM